MGKDTKRSAPVRRRKRRFAIVVFSLFPLLVAAGLFSPGFVRVIAAQEASGTSTGMIEYNGVPSLELRRLPLLVPRDFSPGFIPELLDLDQLFRRAGEEVETSSERLARLLSFPRDHGDAIVIDDVGVTDPEIVFRDALVGDTVADVPLATPPEFLPLGGTLPLGDGVRFDDFPGSSINLSSAPPIPEPGSGLLVGLGLLILVGLRRR